MARQFNLGNWDIYYGELIAANACSPERALMCGMFERTLRDLGLLDSESTVTYYNLRDAADYVFDEPSGEEDWTFRWVLQHIDGIPDPEVVIRWLREYVLEYWTNTRVRKLVYMKP